MVKIFPFIFIVLWSSAFVTTKPIIDNSDPFAALAFRFFVVAFGFYIYSIYTKQKILTNSRNLLQSLFSGVLFHGVYLGGVFYSVSIGMPTGIAALIVTLQPILTNALAGKFLGEKVTFKQWIGVILGFIGAALVLGFDIGLSLPIFGVIASFVALLAITTSTLWQKKISNNLPLSVSNMYQAIGGCSFHIIIILIFSEPYINFTSTFLIAMSHQIFLVSFGAFTILMFLIKNNSASKTVSIFFLIPPTTAIMAWIFLNEKLNNLDLVGFAVATFGVYIATRKQ
ncbi:DMT family transporter [Candidatus Pelagibacter ubique]|nr:DMT family transporter [Candidatus Pelagibacter bacterium]MDA7446908.1 DMT family transporter [Candidatus Pelagibacter ubique]MDA7479972.1 DMT family transporter [Candidatus Pelagibacter ubique]MDA7485820.1 DMT family transporter [Candidatus Pelagibacter ubique]MDB2601148.1 DMT family transporter [Candidatus Pelagibacter bacterium]MDB9757630.1 DMT family transporter [Candidatus Pelagibacter ubique]